ncbi:hypothetical protein BDD12DRAFT_556187 [Trichophaea hybrida]|nr:hypothetical protein BDD12DRAFT_556187 [Trichophaea hybrida]
MVIVLVVVVTVSILELRLVHSLSSYGSHEQPVPLICMEVGTFPEVVLVVATVVTWRNISLRQLHGILTRRRLDNFLTVWRNISLRLYWVSTRCRRDDFLTVRRIRLLTARLHGFRMCGFSPLWRLGRHLTDLWCRLTSACYCGLSSVWPDGLWLYVAVRTNFLPSRRLDT